ncbi:MAG: heat-inducible transcription repressor HrcA [Clostridia bacterium]|nr:heat-inducible transcription repressor HrcA [Clostridia bacterium]
MAKDPGVLTERKKKILKAIIESHIANGEPVGSKYLTENKQIECSSATIRNEMAELEDMGYLEQPHTSAGRIPSELGYRFYVDSLIEDYSVTAKEVEQIHQMMRSKVSELDQIMNMASKVASHLTNYTAIAVKPRETLVTINRFETIFIDEYHFILVLVTSGDVVKTKNITTTRSLTRAFVGQVADSLNTHLAGKSAQEINLPLMMSLETEFAPYSELVSPVMKVVYDTMSVLDQGEMQVAGMDRLLEYPEYKDMESLKRLIGTIEEKEEIVNLVSEAGRDQHNIVIGSESEVKVMENSSLVFKPVVRNGKTVGAIGVIGPLRMDYARVLALLEAVTGNVSELLDDRKLDERKIEDKGDTNHG